MRKVQKPHLHIHTHARTHTHTHTHARTRACAHTHTCPVLLSHYHNLAQGSHRPQRGSRAKVRGVGFEFTYLYGERNLDRKSCQTDVSTTRARVRVYKTEEGLLTLPVWCFCCIREQCHWCFSMHVFEYASITSNIKHILASHQHVQVYVQLGSYVVFVLPAAFVGACRSLACCLFHRSSCNRFTVQLWMQCSVSKPLRYDVMPNFLVVPKLRVCKWSSSLSPVQ